MPATLSPEQNATLQLVLERGQSYSDLAELLGVEEDEVRARARAALEALTGVDPDRGTGLTDYLLGQADPIGRADAVRHLRDEPDDLRLATELSALLRARYPEAELPRLPGEPKAPRRPKAPASDQRGLSLSGRQARLIAIVSAAAILVIVGVLAVAGVFGGDDDAPGAAPTAETDSGSATDSAAPEQELERVELVAPGGGDARGEAIFGLATGDQPYIDLSIQGLDPAPQDQTYVIWLMLSNDQGYPLTPITVTPRGTFDDRFPIPSAVLSVVARVRLVDISIAPVKDLRKAISDAFEREDLILDKPGETVLRGAVPRVEGAEG